MPSMRDAKRESDVVKLERDNWQFGDWGLACDGHHVWLSWQPMGQPREREIEIPKAIFDRMVDAYVAPQGALSKLQR